jgi:hypothetical protein
MALRSAGAGCELYGKMRNNGVVSLLRCNSPPLPRLGRQRWETQRSRGRPGSVQSSMEITETVVKILLDQRK